MPGDSIIDTINRAGTTVKDNIEAGVAALESGTRTTQANKAQEPGGPECQPTSIRNQTNEPTGDGLLSAVESTVFLQLTSSEQLAAAAGSVILLSPVIVPPGFYLILEGVMMRCDEEPATVDVAGSITPAGVAEVSTDLWLPVATAGSPNPKGFVFVGSNVGYVINTGEAVVAPRIPGGFQINFQFFRATTSTNPCDVVAFIMGVLLKDRNYESYRTLV